MAYPNWGAGIRGLARDLPGMVNAADIPGRVRRVPGMAGGFVKNHPKPFIRAGLGVAGAGGAYGGYRGYRRYSSGRNGLQGRSSGGMTGIY